MVRLARHVAGRLVVVGVGNPGMPQLCLSRCVRACVLARNQKSHTYTKRRITAAKKPSQTLQPTPVRSAINSILFMVPRTRSRMLSNWSFIFSARAEESRISSPIATVIYGPGEGSRQLAPLLCRCP